MAAEVTWDRAAAIRAFESAGKLNVALHQSDPAQRSIKAFLRVINKYQEALIKDPHYSGSDDALLQIGKLYQELAETTHRADHARLSSQAYVRLAGQYPSSPYRAESLLAAGEVHLTLLKDPAEAIKQYRRTINLYPGTPPAKAAQIRISELGKQGESVSAADSGSSGAQASSRPAQPLPAQPNSTGGRDLTRVLGLKASKIVLDPGHGGHDDGTQSKSGFKEKDLTLDLALRLKTLIEQEIGLTVILTRDSDVFIPLDERTRIANHYKADFFISIHANFSSQARTSGVETYVLDFARSNSERELAARENASSQRTIADLEDLIRIIARREKLQESRELARSIQLRLQTEMKKQNPASKNRGIKQAPFVVLAGASMPSILAEVAFLSNKRDAESLQQPKNRQSAALALLSGIREYVRTLGMGSALAQKSALK